MPSLWGDFTGPGDPSRVGLLSRLGLQKIPLPSLWGDYTGPGDPARVGLFSRLGAKKYPCPHCGAILPAPSVRPELDSFRDWGQKNTLAHTMGRFYRPRWPGPSWILFAIGARKIPLPTLWSDFIGPGDPTRVGLFSRLETEKYPCPHYGATLSAPATRPELGSFRDWGQKNTLALTMGRYFFEILGFFL